MNLQGKMQNFGLRMCTLNGSSNELGGQNEEEVKAPKEEEVRCQEVPSAVKMVSFNEVIREGKKYEIKE